MRKTAAYAALGVLLAVGTTEWAAREAAAAPDRDFHGEAFQLAFHHPATWTVEERDFDEGRGERARYQLIVQGDQNELAVVTVFRTDVPLDEWIARHEPAQSKGAGPLACTVDGKPAYVVQVAEIGQVNGAFLIFRGADYLYEIGVNLDLLSSRDGQAFLRSVTTEPGPSEDVRTDLPGELFELAKHGTLESAGLVAAGTCCNETDAFQNVYPCCACCNMAAGGNCTWKSEERRSGDNNFIFGGPGRDAYRWMSHAYSYTSYALGGTIPTVGAVVVLGQSYSATGHVATVTGINADGSVQVTEQNCGSTCTRSRAITTATLRTHLAGYIYTGSTPPSVEKAGISPYGESIVDDFNFNNHYYFRTLGPGIPQAWNGNYRAWGTLATGAYNGFMHFTRTQTGASYLNWGRWSVQINMNGNYEIQVFVPNNTYAAATRAVYQVNGVNSRAVNQSTTQNTWVKLSNPVRTDGYWAFNTGIVRVDLYDNYNGQNPENGVYLAFDAIKFIRRP